MNKQFGFLLYVVLSIGLMLTGCSNSTNGEISAEQMPQGNLPDWTPSTSQLVDYASTAKVCGSTVVMPSGFKLHKDHNYPDFGVDVQWFHNIERDDSWFDVEVERGYTTNLTEELEGGVRGMQTLASDQWSSMRPEYGIVNGHTCLRTYWKGRTGSEVFHGFEYVTEAGSGANTAVIKIYGRDYEPFSAASMPSMDLAARRAIDKWDPTL